MTGDPAKIKAMEQQRVHVHFDDDVDHWTVLTWLGKCCAVFAEESAARMAANNINEFIGSVVSRIEADAGVRGEKWLVDEAPGVARFSPGIPAHMIYQDGVRGYIFAGLGQSYSQLIADAHNESIDRISSRQPAAEAGAKDDRSEIKAALDRLDDLYSKTGVDWELTVHHILTEPTCPTISINPEGESRSRFQVRADSIEEGILECVDIVYRAVIIGDNAATSDTPWTNPDDRKPLPSPPPADAGGEVTS